MCLFETSIHTQQGLIVPCRIIHASFAETLWCSKDWSVTLLRFFPPWRKKDNSVSYNPNYFVKWTEGGGGNLWRSFLYVVMFACRQEESNCQNKKLNIKQVYKSFTSIVIKPINQRNFLLIMSKTGMSLHLVVTVPRSILKSFGVLYVQHFTCFGVVQIL